MSKLSKPNGSVKEKHSAGYFCRTRMNFQLQACLLWIRKNRPDVAQAIKAEGHKRWPCKKRARIAKDYAFLSEIETQP